MDETTPGSEQEQQPSWQPCDLKEELRRLERFHLEHALQASEGKITKAAQMLGFRHPESIASIIKLRHPELHAARTIKKRFRSIITKWEEQT